MKKNPKIIAGIAAIVLLMGGLIYMLAQDIPMAAEVRRVMSLTPTPLPPAPDKVTARTPDPSDPAQVKELRYNSVGDEVKRLQARLTELRYYHGDTDGLFYDETKKAVTAFQEANGLTADGIVGEKTWEKLYSENAVACQE